MNGKGISVKCTVSFESIFEALHQAFHYKSEHWIVLSSRDELTQWMLEQNERTQRGHEPSPRGLYFAHPDRPDEPIWLDLRVVSEALNLLAAQYPVYIAEMISEMSDERTTDAFVQFALYGCIAFQPLGW